MPEQQVPQEYLVEGLEAVHYDYVGKNAKAVTFKTAVGKEFTLAKDMMGIQFCAAGRLWPNGKSWPSMEVAIAHLREHLGDAIAFFEVPVPGRSEEHFSVGDVLFAGVVTAQNRQ